ncbi:hypothetical protein ACI65C_012629 [Semiaphis heraclei]
MCARARYRFKERSRGAPGTAVTVLPVGERAGGQAFRTAAAAAATATVRRGPKDERVCVMPYYIGGRLADVPTPLPPQTAPPQRQSPVSTTSSTTCALYDVCSRPSRAVYAFSLAGFYRSLFS